MSPVSTKPEEKKPVRDGSAKDFPIVFILTLVFPGGEFHYLSLSFSG